MRSFDVCWLVLLAYTFITVNANTYHPVTKSNQEWWEHTILYQLYPRSFKDSNDDGIGDLKGITQKLDHFVDLGIETLWIGPIFKSPMDDMGYDVENFTMIDPVFGTMEDFDELVSEMNKRNLKFVTDLVPNHSSYKCEWFKKSIRREGKYTDYYIWLDAKNQKEVIANSSIKPIPPNNWLSVFGGSAWTWNNERKQFYYHQFTEKQPDFKIRNPEVHREINNILTFWMDKGISGFRFDAIKHLYESESFQDEPYFPGKEGSLNFDDLNHTLTVDQPEVYDHIYEWREVLDNYTRTHHLSHSRIISTESYSSLEILKKYYGDESNAGAQIPFNFRILKSDPNRMVDSLELSINSWLTYMGENLTANWVLENHDNPRVANKFGPGMVPLMTALTLALPGVDVTYYGGEIGLENTFVRKDQRQDPNNAGGARADESRDPERCPMLWDNSINAGFTRAKKPWLPVNPNYYKTNVEAQKKVPTSNYNFFKKMSQLRKTNTLKYGALQTYNVSQSVYILMRSLPQHESYFVVMNFGTETEPVVLSSIIEQNLNSTLNVYLGCASSMYKPGDVVSTRSMSNTLVLRPQSVVVLTDRFVQADAPKSSSTRCTSTLISVLCVLLFTKFFL